MQAIGSHTCVELLNAGYDVSGCGQFKQFFKRNRLTELNRLQEKM